VTSTSNHLLDFVDEFEAASVDDSSSNQATLNLPSNPQRGQVPILSISASTSQFPGKYPF
jgi:hypothetical protein